MKYIFIIFFYKDIEWWVFIKTLIGRAFGNFFCIFFTPFNDNKMHIFRVVHL